MSRSRRTSRPRCAADRQHEASRLSRRRRCLIILASDLFDSEDRTLEALSQLRATHPNALVLAYQTVVREYLPNPEREQYLEGMRAFVRGGRALWIELEADPARVARKVKVPPSGIASMAFVASATTAC